MDRKGFARRDSTQGEKALADRKPDSLTLRILIPSRRWFLQKPVEWLRFPKQIDRETGNSDSAPDRGQRHS
jgi:hypothetical protein